MQKYIKTTFRYRYLMIILLLSYMSLSYAQEFDNQKIDMPVMQKISPEVASLGTFGKIPVNSNTGNPDISIPLYTVKSGEINLPLSLCYDASGIKVSQEATWVGLGWNLIAGGSLTMYISGDESDFYLSANHDYSPSQNEHKHFLLNKYDTNNIVKAPAALSEMAHRKYEPNIYQAIFCGHKVTFFKNANGNYVQIGILENNYSIRNTSSGWSITDDLGVEYIFGYEGKEWYHTEIGEEANKTQTWNLTQIIHPVKGVIHFEYTSAVNIKPVIEKWEKSTRYYSTDTTSLVSTYITNQYDFQYEYFDTKDSLRLKYGQYRYIIPVGQNSHSQSYNMNYDFCSMYKPYLRKITSEREIVEFSLEDREDLKGGKKLNTIRIKDKMTGSVVKTICFNYDYFISSGYSSYTYLAKRLKLNSLSIGDQLYTFEYDSAELPCKDSKGKDFWGYYNGGSSRLPSVYFYSDNKLWNIGTGSGFASESHAKAGMLKKITYPTKGYTRFNYELHTFTNAIPNLYDGGYGNKLYQGGGFRIKSIFDYDSNNACIDSTLYEYTGGYLQLPVNNTEIDKVGVLCTYRGALYCRQFYSLSISSSPRLPLFTSLMASPVTYSTVRSIKGNVITTKNYFNEHADTDMWMRYIQEENGDRNWGDDNGECPNFVYLTTGQLSSQIIEQIDGEDTKLVEEIRFIYNRYDDNLYFWVNTYAKPLIMQGSMNYTNKIDRTPYSRVISYPFIARRPLKLSEIKWSYFGDEDEARIESVEYDYSSTYHLPVKITKSTEDIGYTTEYTIKYPWNFSGVTHNSMLNKRMFKYPIESIKSIGGNIVSKSKNVYSLVNDTPMPTSHLWSFGDNEYQTKMSILYDENLNIIQTTKQDSIPTVFLWSYRNTLPVLKIEGITKEELDNIIPEETLSDLSESIEPDTIIESIRNILSNRNVIVTDCKYIPLIGVREETAPNGYKTSYFYDNQNRLTNIKDNSGRDIKKYEYNYSH